MSYLRMAFHSIVNSTQAGRVLYGTKRFCLKKFIYGAVHISILIRWNHQLPASLRNENWSESYAEKILYQTLDLSIKAHSAHRNNCPLGVEMYLHNLGYTKLEESYKVLNAVKYWPRTLIIFSCTHKLKLYEKWKTYCRRSTSVLSWMTWDRETWPECVRRNSATTNLLIPQRYSVVTSLRKITMAHTPRMSCSIHIQV